MQGAVVCSGPLLRTLTHSENTNTLSVLATQQETANMESVQYQSQVQVDDRTRALVEQSAKVVLATHVEPTADMAVERARASFDARGLAEHLNGGREKLQRM